MTPEEIIEETGARMAELIPKIRVLREELSTFEKEFAKLSNTRREAQISVFPIKKIPLNVSSKSNSHHIPSQVISKMSASEAAELLHLLERRLST